MNWKTYERSFIEVASGIGHKRIIDVNCVRGPITKFHADLEIIQNLPKNRQNITDNNIKMTKCLKIFCQRKEQGSSHLYIRGTCLIFYWKKMHLFFRRKNNFWLKFWRFGSIFSKKDKNRRWNIKIELKNCTRNRWR